MAKPILDALKDLAYLDDDQVTDLVVRRRNRDDDLRLGSPSPILAAGFACNGELVHVLVRTRRIRRSWSETDRSGGSGG